MQSRSLPKIDEVLLVLSNVHRRRMLLKLLDHNPRDERMELTDRAAEEADATLDELEIEMFHVHLPKLAEEGFVDWDREAEEVTKGPRFDEIRPLLQLMVDHADELPEGWI
jgi:hypothetical protein